MRSQIQAIDDLHRRYDGPVPKHELRAVMSGDVERGHAMDRRFWRDQVRASIMAIRLNQCMERQEALFGQLERDWLLYRRAHRAYLAARYGKPMMEAAE